MLFFRTTRGCFATLSFPFDAFEGVNGCMHLGVKPDPEYV
jgi:hypothetical protein